MLACGMEPKIENKIFDWYILVRRPRRIQSDQKLQHFWTAFQIDASNAASIEIPTAAHPPTRTIPASPVKAWGLVDGELELGAPALLVLLLLLVLLVLELL